MPWKVLVPLEASVRNRGTGALEQSLIHATPSTELQLINQKGGKVQLYKMLTPKEIRLKKPKITNGQIAW